MNGVMNKPRRCAYRSFTPKQQVIKRLGDLGVDLVCINPSNTLNSLGTPYCLHPPHWLHVGVYDWAIVDRQFDEMIEANPRVHFLCMVDLNTPAWLVRYSPNARDADHEDSFTKLGRIAASEEWRQYTGDYLEAFLKHCEAKYGPRITGYILFCGWTTEWQNQSKGEGSPCRRSAWRQWCRDRGHGDRVDPSVRPDLAQWDNIFASALWAGRYRWGEAGLRREADGLAIFNPGDRNSREMFAFYDTVPNATYGPLCRWGDAGVTADIRFEYGSQPPKAWGRPAFALTTRIAPQRRAMYFLRIEVPSRQADPANPVVMLHLGRMLRGGAGEGLREDPVFAEAPVLLPADGEFRLTLAAHTVDDDTVRLTGICQWPDGTNRETLTAERSMRDDGTAPWGEVGFAARLHEFTDAPEAPNHILLRSFNIGPVPQSGQGAKP